MGTRLRLHAAGLNESRQLSLEVVTVIGFMFRKFFVSLERCAALADWIQTFYSHLCRKSGLIRGIERVHKEER